MLTISSYSLVSQFRSKEGALVIDIGKGQIGFMGHVLFLFLAERTFSPMFSPGINQLVIFNLIGDSLQDRPVILTSHSLE